MALATGDHDAGILGPSINSARLRGGFFQKFARPRGVSPLLPPEDSDLQADVRRGS